MTLLPRCLCGSTDALLSRLHGLAVLRCGCGILRQQVDLDAAAYADWYRTKYHAGIYYHTEAEDRAVARQRLDAYALAGGTRLLDVGSGNNAFVAEARSRGIDAWGQDIAEQANGPYTYVGALPDIHFPTDHFDAVTLHDVLEHVVGPRALLGEVRRILKPAGRLVVDFPNFHDPAGAHHWKPVEHLWMLTETQLARLLRSEGFHVETIGQPVPSKLVFGAVNRPTDSPVRILVPAGIGDGYWVLVKLRGFLEARGIVLPEVWGHDAGPRRSEEFWRRVPFVRWGGYAGLPMRDPIARRAYTEPGYAVQENVHGFDYFLSCNGDLEAGRSIDEAIAGPADWYPPLWRPKTEARAREEYRRRFGRYVMTAFWDRGFYQHWLTAFGEDAIATTLRTVADAGHTVVITGADWDRGRIGSRLATADSRFIDLIGETSFPALMGLLSGAAGVFGFPAGSTLLGPYFRVPTVLLWHEHFPPAMWRHCVAPDAVYAPLYVRDVTPDSVASALLDLMAGVRPTIEPPRIRPSRTLHGRVLGAVALSQRHRNAGVLERRSEACGASLAPATLQVAVDDVSGALRALGRPVMESEPAERLGALCWWPVQLAVGALRTSGWVIRHEHGRSAHLDVVSETSFAAVRARTPATLALDGALPDQPAPSPSRPQPKPPVRRPAPRPAPKPAAQTARAVPVAADLVAAARAAGIAHPERTLVLGGGATVWQDVQAAEALLSKPWDGLVVACNDVGCHWPRRLDHWATLHPEKLGQWKDVRRALGHPDGYLTWARQAGKGRGVDRVMAPWNGGGSSGLLAVAVAFHLGCEKIILCGMPMNRTPHFAESKVHVKGRVWSSADSHWRAWTKGENVERMKDRVRSFGGRTADLLGVPSAEWLLGESEAAA